MIRSDIQKKLNDVKDIKLNMRNAIHSRSVDIDADTLFKDYPQKIDEIPDPNYLYAITGNWGGDLDTLYFNPDVHYVPAFTGANITIDTVVLHKDIIELGLAAFAEPETLNTIMSYPASPPTLGSLALSLLPKETIIKVPPESLQAYKSADGWSAFASQIEAM